MKKTIAAVAVLVYSFIVANISSAQVGDAPSAAPPDSSTARPFNLTAEALVWWLKDSPAPPPLVSTGILGQPGTAVILGGKDADTDEHPGFRLTASYWDREKWGLEGSIFYLPSQSTSRSAGSSGETGSLSLSIPFFDVTIPGESETGLSFPGQFSGQATEKLNARLLGAELNGVGNLLSTGALRLDLLGGFRYLNLRENFSFTTSSPNIPPGPPDVFRTKDQFDTNNDFYGGQVGARARYGSGPWILSGSVKLGLGAMVQSVEIDGYLFTNDFNGFGDPQLFPGGYFAQPTNIGNHGRTVFAVVPEIAVNVGYEVTKRMTIFFGYTFLYANNMVRPGDQIDRGINPTQNASFGGPPPTPLVGPARPEFKAHGSSFWAQGLNAGVAFRF